MHCAVSTKHDLSIVCLVWCYLEPSKCQFTWTQLKIWDTAARTKFTHYRVVSLPWPVCVVQYDTPQLLALKHGQVNVVVVVCVCVSGRVGQTVVNVELCGWLSWRWCGCLITWRACHKRRVCVCVCVCVCVWLDCCVTWCHVTTGTSEPISSHIGYMYSWPSI